jgi:predicted metalloenzyme YecM
MFLARNAGIYYFAGRLHGRDEKDSLLICGRKMLEDGVYDRLCRIIQLVGSAFSSGEDFKESEFWHKLDTRIQQEVKSSDEFGRSLDFVQQQLPSELTCGSETIEIVDVGFMGTFNILVKYLLIRKIMEGSHLSFDQAVLKAESIGMHVVLLNTSLNRASALFGYSYKFFDGSALVNLMDDFPQPLDYTENEEDRFQSRVCFSDPIEQMKSYFFQLLLREMSQPATRIGEKREIKTEGELIPHIVRFFNQCMRQREFECDARTDSDRFLEEMFFNWLNVSGFSTNLPLSIMHKYIGIASQRSVRRKGSGSYEHVRVEYFCFKLLVDGVGGMLEQLQQVEFGEILCKARAAVTELGGAENSLNIDHIGFQMKSDAEAGAFVDFLRGSNDASVVREQTHNGRKIFVVRLGIPINVKGVLINALEIQCPKQGVSYESSVLEHIAFSYTGEGFDGLYEQACEVQSGSRTITSFTILKPPFTVGASRGFKPVFSEISQMIEIRNDTLLMPQEAGLRSPIDAAL